MGGGRCSVQTSGGGGGQMSGHDVGRTSMVSGAAGYGGEAGGGTATETLGRRSERTRAARVEVDTGSVCWWTRLSTAQ